MKRLAIIGASGHGKVVADIAKKNGYKEIVFLDDDCYSNGRLIRFDAATIFDPGGGQFHKFHLESGSIYDAGEYPYFLKMLAFLYPDHYAPDWDNFHQNHPEVEISDDEALAWWQEQPE